MRYPRDDPIKRVVRGLSPRFSIYLTSIYPFSIYFISSTYHKRSFLGTAWLSGAPMRLLHWIEAAEAKENVRRQQLFFYRYCLPLSLIQLSEECLL